MISSRFKKKNSIILLAALMSISLMGIVAVQYLWIAQSIKSQEEQLENLSYIAVNRTVFRLEREQSAAFMLNPFFHNPKVMPPPSFSPFGVQQPPKNEGKTRFEAHISVNGKEYNRTFDWDENSDNNMELTFDDALSQMKDSIQQVMGMLDNGDNSISQIFKQMVREFESHRGTPMQPFSHDEVNRVLNEELNNMGVKIPVEFAIVENNSGKTTSVKTSNFISDNPESVKEIDVPLFPNNIFRMWGDYRLKVQLPFTALFLMRTQASLLTISALFTLFILATFLYTLRTIIYQKKVSDIKSDFINNMTHEFKTPIATISLATDSIATPSVLGRPDTIKSFLSIIKEENTRMNSQVERILQMALIDKKDFSIMTTPTDLNELIQKSIQNMSLFISESGGKVDLSLYEGRLEANLDTVHITNVIVNLVENAIKYSKSSPVVKITTQLKDNYIQMIVSDNGIGMSKEQQNKMFEKFYRAAGGNIHNVKGFGLGLSYVKAVIDAHNGTITVKSKPGEGSEFTISILKI